MCFWLQYFCKHAVSPTNQGGSHERVSLITNFFVFNNCAFIVLQVQIAHKFLSLFLYHNALQLAICVGVSCVYLPGKLTTSKFNSWLSF